MSNEVGYEELLTEEKFVIEKKLERKGKIEKENFKSFEWWINAPWKYKKSAIKQIMKLLKCTI